MMLHSNTFTYSQSLTIQDGASVYLVGETGTSSVNVLFMSFDSTLGGIEVELLENVTYSAGVNAVIHNKNRSSTTVSKFGILEGATVTNDGQLLRLTAAPLSDSPSNKIVGVNDMDDSWKLKKNTKYALKLTNINNASIDVYANFEWAEHEML